MEGVNIAVLPLGAQAGSTNKPLMRVPTTHGGITLLNAWIVSAAAATTIFQLANMGTALGTTISSVIGTLNGTLVANVQKAVTISTAYQDAGTWIALASVSGDTLNADSKLILEYKYGK